MTLGSAAPGVAGLEAPAEREQAPARVGALEQLGVLDRQVEAAQAPFVPLAMAAKRGAPDEVS